MSVLEMKVPSPGESITEVEIAEWMVEDGDYVEKDQTIAEVDSDKATLELPAEEAGIITLKAEMGDVVAVGQVVCLIDTAAPKPEGSKSSAKAITKSSTPAPREDIPYKTRNWNFSLCFIKPSFSKIFSSPTKQGELMGMGIPIICNSGVGDVDFIVEKYKSGFVLKDLNKVNFEIILNANFKKQKLIEGANQYFSLEKGVISYLKIYRKIC